tara:strand:+ start:507 stop:1145 length:639 start_codon:yes stop_codon:yes gene_type:complete
MQSDTFLNNTDSEDEEYSSDSSGDLPENNNVGVKYDVPKDYSDLRFLDQSKQDEYLKLRNELFTKKVEKGRIVFNTNYTLDGSTAYKSELDLVDKYKLNGLPNVIGFELIRANIKSASASVHFIDLHVPEIPHIACKQNEYGTPIIDRIPLNLSTSTINNYTQHRDYQNYFTPIKLSKLNLVVILPDGTKTTDYEGFYEFEITVLKDSLSKR